MVVSVTVPDEPGPMRVRSESFGKFVGLYKTDTESAKRFEEAVEGRVVLAVRGSAEEGRGVV